MNNQLRIKLSCAVLTAGFAMAVFFTGCKGPQQMVNSFSVTSGTNGAWGQTLPFPTPISGDATCLPGYCGFIAFNNGTAGFSPTCTNPTITVKVGGVVQPAANYEVQWRYGGLPSQKGCATPYDDTHKTYSNILNKRYTYTVYFRSPCPAAGTLIEILIECAGGGAMTGAASMGNMTTAVETFTQAPLKALKAPTTK